MLIMEIDIKNTGFGDIYPENHKGWDKLFKDVLAERKAKRERDDDVQKDRPIT